MMARSSIYGLLALGLLAAAVPGEPPPGPWVLATYANSAVDGVDGAQLGLEVGARLPVSRSVGLLVAGGAARSPKIETGNGVIYVGQLEVERHAGRWFGAVGASYAVLRTSTYNKDVWHIHVSIGREIGPVRLLAQWSGPRPTRDRLTALGLALECRRRHGVLRAGLAWAEHANGEGLRLTLGLGWAR